MSGRTWRRLGVGLLALAVAAGAITVASIALRPAPRPPAPAGRAVPHPNGPIWFLGGEHPLSIFSRSGVYWVDPEGGEPNAVPMPEDLSSNNRLAVSPDRLIAISSGGGEFPPRNIYVLKADGSHVRQITSGRYYDTSPAWSPDGRAIVFSSTRCCSTEHSSGNYALYVVAPDGSGLRRITDGRTSALEPAWSPDGTRIAYVVFPPDVPRPPPEENRQVWVVNADGTHARHLTDDRRYDDALTWSPDGERIAYISHLGDDLDWQIRVMRADGGGQRTLFACTGRCARGGFSLVWSPSGGEIAFTVVSANGERQQIAVIDADGSHFRILDTQGLNACCLAWIPAG